MRDTDDEAPAPFLSRRRTASSRRPGVVFDRPVVVRVCRVVPCRACGGRRLEGTTGPHAVRSNGRGRLIDCAGRTCRRGPHGFELEARP